MSLLLKWQAKQITLYRRGAETPSSEEQLLGTIELDFELGPSALIDDEKRHRLLAAIAQLKSNCGVEDGQVDLFIPVIWGITHRVPNPDLPKNEMQEHLQWELSKTVIDPQDHYRFNFAYDADDSVILAAIRVRLVEAIDEVLREAGFHLRGLFLDEDPWKQVNLTTVALESAEIEAHSAEPPEKESATPIRSTAPRSAGRSGQTKFFGIVLLLGVILVAVFVWWKLSTTQKAPRKTPTPAATATTTPTPSDTTTAHQAPSGAAVGYWTSMAQRVNVLKLLLKEFDQKNGFDHISFTENQFLCQITTTDRVSLDRAVALLKKNADFADVKLSVAAAPGGSSHGVISGRIVATSGSEPITPTQAELTELGGQFGLRNEALVFTGKKTSSLNFLDALSSHNYSIYRLILLPWSDNEFRIVLEL